MIRLLVRELLVVVAMFLLASVAAFCLLDLTGHHDWFGTRESGRRAGLTDDHATGRDLPLLFNRHVSDARTRTLNDLADLSGPTAPGARARLIHRGTAALPTILGQLRMLEPEVRDATLTILADMAAGLTGGERPPTDPTLALEYWERFSALRGLDFRVAYSRRLVQRLVEHESRNAVEQLQRLGTFALPELFEVLDGPLDTDSARRLTDVIAGLTGRPLRISATATVAQMREIVDAWRAFWFAERLEYEQLGDIRRTIAHVTETRYGRWLTRAFSGRLGPSRVTHAPILGELRDRVPRSVLVGGLGGLLGIAFVVAFGGGAALRRRPLGVKLLDLAGALIPGLGAFVLGFVLLNQLLVAPQPVVPQLLRVLRRPASLALAVVTLAPLAVVWLRRKSARVMLHAVRIEAETWARETRRPKVVQVLRHGLRVGMASLLAPVSLAALPLVLMTLLVEPLVGVRGMGALTVASVLEWDAPWLLVAALTVVPLWLLRRWSERTLVWALGGPLERTSGPDLAPPTSSPPPPPPQSTQAAYAEVLASGGGTLRAPKVPKAEA